MVNSNIKESSGYIHRYNLFCSININGIVKNVEDHLINVATTFANLKVNLDKTHFMKAELEFLG